MLLLVLILVLIAFGLFVVALLSGSILWAWVSVGVSVAAAGVLLVDWLQRRAAVRAGSEAGAAAQAEVDVERRAYDEGRDRGRTVADIDPVTEVIPVVRPENAGTGDTYPRFDPAADETQQTVVMPVVQPSGSAELPSGAIPATTPSSGNSSLSVTESGMEAPADRWSEDAASASLSDDADAAFDAEAAAAPASTATPGTADPETPVGEGADIRSHETASAGPPSDTAPETGTSVAGEAVPVSETTGDGEAPGDSDAESTVAVPAAAAGSSAPATSVVDPVESGDGHPEMDENGADRPLGAGGAGDTDTAVPAAVAEDEPEPVDQTDADRPAEATTALPAVAGASAASAAAGQRAGDPPGGLFAEPSRSNGVGSRPIDPASASGAPPSDALPPTGYAPRLGAPPAWSRQRPGGLPAATQPPPPGEQVLPPPPPPPGAQPPPGLQPPPPPGAQPPPDAPPAEAEVPPPPLPDFQGEPPVEPSDPAVAAFVAGLVDEVVVVDEQPRYHAVACRSLLGKPIIPLPVGEAVELGFTPCGWCNPDRFLGERHRADVR